MNAPTLIVGLGGKGSDIVLRVANLASDEERKRIGFVVFDTDANELREIKDANPYVETIQTSTNLTVGEYLNIDTHSRDTWFPVNSMINRKALTEGAGQIRSVSRLAFETAVRAGKMEPLHRAMENLYKLEGSEYEQAMRVIIVSSLAGGTGSGLILPVAFYIRHYLRTRFRQSANITRGFFILPEVFYQVISGEKERNNLKSNAYAALRELDAFLMKGDSTLPKRFENSVKIQMPKPGTDEYEEYDFIPYDFCFLFDAQNCDGKKLNSFNQYLDHAANCIYAQSIGPMNKRSNSSEDNTIRALAKEKGRNRYAGAGTSMLIYPVEDVKEYMALKWTKQCVSDRWLVYDRALKERSANNEDRRRKGVRPMEVRPDRFYISQVEQMASNGDDFSNSIKDSCTPLDASGMPKFITDDEGMPIYIYNWNTYLEALQKKVEDETSEGNEDLDIAKRTVLESLRAINGEELSTKPIEDVWGVFIEAYGNLKTYKTKVEKVNQELAPSLAYNMFQAPMSVRPSAAQNFQIEKYMVDTSGNFIHPNAVRYFLYKSLDKMKKEKLVVDEACKEVEDFFNNFEHTYFDNKETEDVEETVYDLGQTKKMSKADQRKKRLSSDQEDLKKGYTNLLGKIDEYRTKQVYRAVLEEGIKYLSKLAEAYRMFYMSMEDKISSIDKQIALIETKRESMRGTAARYVCASQKCLRKMASDMSYQGSALEIDSELSEQIYCRVREYSMYQGKDEADKPDNIEFFKSLFNDDIIGYYRNKAMDIYGSSIDMDIIEAIEKEANYEKNIYDPSEVKIYVKHVIDETKILATPFIEKPLGEEAHPIPACTFNKKLSPNDGSDKAQLIESELLNFGGKPDADIPKNKILFYKSFYGLRATDLSKFAPPETSATYTRQGGEYFKAYYSLVNKIYPDSNKSKCITPHIDKWWHNVSMMPDLDDDNHKIQEDAIEAAYFWSLLSGYVDLYETDGFEKTYRIDVEDLGMEGEESDMIVSNLTPCDKLYEVLDALNIYPELVGKVNEKIRDIVDLEKNDTVGLEQSKVYNWLKSFRVKEFPLGKDNAVRSIFDIPLLMRRSMPIEAFYIEDALSIIKTEIREVKWYFNQLCMDNAREYTAEFIYEQFERFLTDVEAEKDAWRNIYREEMFSRICKIIRLEMEKLDRSKALVIEQKVKELTK